MEKKVIEVEYCGEELPSVRLFPIKNIGVIGSRKLPSSYRGQVQHIVDYLIHGNYHVASGGAKGTDAYVLDHLLRRERADCGVLFSAWDTFKGFPVELRKPIRYFQQQGGAVMWGVSSGQESRAAITMALLQRNVRMVEACEGLVAFLTAESRGTFFTLKEAVKRKKKLVVFPIGRELPGFQIVKWVPLKCGGCWEGAYKAVYLR